MCGILFAAQPLSVTASSVDSLLPKPLVNAVGRRGPDAGRRVEWKSTSHRIELLASVLHLRGDAAVEQPVELSNGDLLCWNGEIFGGTLKVDEHLGDTLAIAKELAQMRKAGISTQQHIADTLSRIHGPFAMLYLDRTNGQVYFARDALGRRSLLVHWPTREDDMLIVTSVASWTNADGYYDELAPGLHCVELNGKTIESSCLSWGKSGLTSPYSFTLSRENTKPSDHVDFSTIENIRPVPRGDISLDLLLSCFPTSIPQSIQDCVASFLALLTDAVRRRVTNVAGDSTIAVLFSGGLDCTILAMLVDRAVPDDVSIDLLNVAFENPRSLTANVKLTGKSDIYDVPDRRTGRRSFEELCSLSPSRTWNFIEINVPYAEYQLQRPSILDCMYPSRTVMDLSIAAAFWFAGRGCGQLVSRDGNGGFIRFPGEPYTTPSRVLISGLGADELFGGYSHHRSAFLNAADDADALEQFANTLQRDLDRLPLRNLGRDDRLYSDHGKELRLPYLDEHVVNYATAVIPLSYKSVFRTAEGTVVPRGLGDKFFLRWCAWSMGLRGVSVERKRAVQFGARTAKMENKEERGDDAVDL